MKIIIKSMGNEDYLAYLKPRLPSAVWCFDKYHDHMETFMRALSMAGSGPALHMEDDIILTRDFLTKVDEVVRRVGEGEVIQFFSLRPTDLTAGSRWDRAFMMNQCTYLPQGLSGKLLEYSDSWRPRHPEHPTGSDVMLRDYLRASRKPYWLHVPSLVQHREDVSNINPRRSKFRQSKTFVDPWL